MGEGLERDAGLKEVADQLVPSEAQVNIGRIDSGSDRTRATAIEKLRKLVQLSGLAKGGLTKSRLLLRVAMVKRLLDEARPGTEGTTEKDLDPESLIVNAETVAKAMPTGIPPFQWAWGVLLSGLLGVVGFVTAHLFEPVVNACGAILASIALRRSVLNKILEEKLKVEAEKALKS